MVVWGGKVDGITSTVSTPVGFDKRGCKEDRCLLLSLPLQKNNKMLNIFIDRFTIDLYTKISHNLKTE